MSLSAGDAKDHASWRVRGACSGLPVRPNVAVRGEFRIRRRTPGRYGSRYGRPGSLQGELICYGRAVVNDEWPKMAKSEESAAVTHWVEQLDSTLQTIPAADEKAVAVFHNWFAQSEARQEGRRGRIAEAAPFVPGFVWGVLIALLVLVVTVLVLFADPDVPLLPQAATVVGVAASLVAGLTLVWMLDRPFNDRGAAIPPTRMTATVQTMEQAYGSSAKPLPCDVNGQPME